MIKEKLWQATEERFAKLRKHHDRIRVAMAEKRSPLDLDAPARVRSRLRRLGYDALSRRVTRRRRAAAAEVSRELAQSDELRRIALERVLGTSELTPVSFLDEGCFAATSVGRVRVRDFARRLAGWGTGFLVSPRLLLTNNHVLESEAWARNSQIELNYQEGPLGNLLRTSNFDLDPGRFFVTDEALDYTLVAVRERSTAGEALASFPWNGLIAESGKALATEPVNIVQHPNGEPKQVALRANRVLDVFEDFVHYTADTSPGSSGSPVFNDQWEVVALHHSGVPRRDEAGRVLTRDGTFWRPGLEPDWIANEGVRISRIVANLEKRRLSGDAAALRSQMFELAQPVWSLGRGRGGEAAGGAMAGGGAEAVAEPAADGIVEVTVPVKVRIAVPPPPTVELPKKEKPVVVGADYYNAEADRAAREEYYRDVDLDAGRGELFDALSSLLAASHARKIRYRDSRLEHLYPRIDLHPDGLLRSIYSGDGFAPEEIIAAELALEARLEARAAELVRQESALGREAMVRELELFEDSLPYNCEHVVPQSWFGRSEPMRGDLHHLYTCEMRCNSFRSNTPFFDFPNFEESVRDACGKSESEGFEPMAGKGAAARSTLYFLLRYPRAIRRSRDTVDAQRLKTLIAWHQAFPVAESPWELHRHQTIFEAQGNRNPLIDHPELAPKIDFQRGLR